MERLYLYFVMEIGLKKPAIAGFLIEYEVFLLD